MGPFIGVTSSVEEDGQPVVRPWYVRAVHEAGGLPVPLPFVTTAVQAGALLDRLHGVLLSGSDDLHSDLWGEPLHPQARLMHPARQATELLLCRALLERPGLPVLAICGGMQTLAVVAGGALHQHLPDLGPHVLDHHAGFDGPPHPVETCAGSVLAELLGGSAQVNTAHHQGIARLGQGMVAAAHAPDGVLEGWEMPGRAFALGVQWHPERMLGQPAQRRLLQAFVAAASRPTYP